MEDSYMKNIARRRRPRKSNFKTKKDRNAVELRRAKRESDYHKRRLLILLPPSVDCLEASCWDPRVLSYSPCLSDEKFSLDAKLGAINRILTSEVPAEVHYFTLERLRQVLSKEDSGPIITYIVSIGMIDTLLDCLSSHCQEIRDEASWCLANIIESSHEHANLIVKKNGVPKLMLHSENAYWALANLAGDCTEIRQELLKNGILDWAFQAFPQMTLSSAKVISWLLANLAKNSEYMKLSEIEFLMKILAQMLELKDDDILAEYLWAHAFICNIDERKIQFVIDCGVISQAFAGLDSHNDRTLKGAVRLIGNVCTGKSSQCDFLLKDGLLEKLHSFLTHHDPCVRKDVFWIYSNIVAGSQQQLFSVVFHSSFPKITQGILDSDLSVKIEASRVLFNITKNNLADLSKELFKYLNLIGIGISANSDENYLFMLLDILFDIVNSVKSDEFMLEKIKESKLYGCLDVLVSHANSNISDLSIGILKMLDSVSDDIEMSPEDEFDFY